MHANLAIVATALLLHILKPGLAETPWNEIAEATTGRQDVPTLTLRLADQHAFLDMHGSKLGLHARNIRSLAAQGFEEQDLAEAGTWQQVPSLGHVWRIGLQSPGVQSHILIFSEVQLPEGGTLRLYSRRYGQHVGSCEHDCHQYTAQDIDVSGRLVVPEIAGEEVVVEYFHREKPLDSLQLKLRLASVLQGFAESIAEVAGRRRRQARRLTAQPPMAGPNQAPDMPADSALGPAPPQQAQGTQFNVDQMQKTSDGVSQCTPSAQCATGYSQEAAGVVDIYAIDMRLGAMGLCTGTLVNAPLGKRYLLTADHCFVDKMDISNFQWWLLIFNYQLPCRSKDRPPPIRQVIQGTKLLFYDSKSDVLLLDIPNTIPDNFQAYKVGFDASEDVPSRAVSIHHPGGNIKRISYANSTNSVSTEFQAPNFSEDIHPTNQTHFQVRWTQGATQGGSSGAALIDASSRKIVGVLTGGTTTCDVFSGADYFGRLSVAWRNGLQNFLSDAPSLLDKGQGGLSTVTQYASGVVVVDTLQGAALPRHGPAINFWPSVFVMGPENVTRIAFYLTDSPAQGETISATIAIKGDLPGNQLNAVPHVRLSTYSYNFTADNCCSKAQPLEITTRGLGGTVPGDLLRLQIVFWLTSSTNASYLHVSAVKGVIQSGYAGWNSLQPVACLKAPCYFSDPILATAPPTYPLPTRAVFRYSAPVDTIVAQDVCLQDGFLDLATVSVYINGTFTWTLSQSYDNSECVHIPGLDVPAGLAMYTVISDNDDYEGVLPIGAVKSVNIYKAGEEVGSYQQRPSGAAEIVAAVTDQWRHDASVPPMPASAAIAAAGGPSATAGGPAAAAEGASGGPNLPRIGPTYAWTGAPTEGPSASEGIGSRSSPGSSTSQSTGVSGYSGGTAAASQGKSPPGNAQQGAVTAASTSASTSAADSAGRSNPFGGEKSSQAEAAKAPGSEPGQRSGQQAGSPGYMSGTSAAVVSVPSAAFNSNG